MDLSCVRFEIIEDFYSDYFKIYFWNQDGNLEDWNKFSWLAFKLQEANDWLIHEIGYTQDEYVFSAEDNLIEITWLSIYPQETKQAIIRLFKESNLDLEF